MNRAAMPVKPFILWIGIIMLALMQACGGGGTRARPSTPVTPPGPNDLVAKIDLAASKLGVKSDNSDTSTLTVTALDANNAVVQGATVVFTTSTGVIAPGAVVTAANGSGTVDFSSGGADPTSRTAVITATVNGKADQLPIQISGSTVSLSNTSTNLPDDGSSTSTLTALVKNAGGSPVAGAQVAAAASGGGSVTVSPASGTTDVNGQIVFTVTGRVAGSATVSIAALGETRTQSYTIAPTATAFKIDQINGSAVPPNHLTATQLLVPVTVRVNAPTSTNVAFATTSGNWVTNGNTSVIVPVVGGKATAQLNPTRAGIANVQVFDPANSALTDAITVAITSVTAAKIRVQISPSAVARSSGGTVGTATLLATVVDANDQPVGGVPIAFQVVNPTGGGENVSPAVVFSASTPTAEVGLGQAKATFSSGSVSSNQSGVQIRASVVGTAVTTGSTSSPAPSAGSGFDATVVIGGTAASVALGIPSEFSDTPATYIMPMSLVVADSNGNPVAGQTVTLSSFPIAFNTGGACSTHSDANGDDPATVPVETSIFRGTFFNEDVNENFIIDSGEDGRREFYRNGNRGQFAATAGSTDNIITPASSSSGTVPTSVITDANGVATFNLTYNKESARHIVARIRASTVVQGTETIGELRFFLPSLKKDDDPPEVCFLSPSPWTF